MLGVCAGRAVFVCLRLGKSCVQIVDLMRSDETSHDSLFKACQQDQAPVTLEGKLAG